MSPFGTRHSIILSVAVLSAQGCTSGSSGASINTMPRPGGTVLTAEDVAPFRDAFLAVHSLRRQWLTGRSAEGSHTPAVFVDGVLSTGIDALAQFTPSNIREIRYLPSIEATTRFGNQFGSGVILVTTFR